MSFVNRYLESEEGLFLSHVAFTFRRTVILPKLTFKQTNPEVQVACLESYLINLRSISDFLFNSGRKDDISASQFAPRWEKKLPSNLEIIRNTINKHVSHLTKSRLLESTIPIEGNIYDFFSPLQTILEESIKDFILRMENTELSSLFESLCFPEVEASDIPRLDIGVASTLLSEIREMYSRQVIRNQQFTNKSLAIFGFQISIALFVLSNDKFLEKLVSNIGLYLPFIYLFLQSLWEFSRVIQNYKASRPGHSDIYLLLKGYLKGELFQDKGQNPELDVLLNLIDSYTYNSKGSQLAPLKSETGQADSRGLRFNGGVLCLTVSFFGILTGTLITL
jgi:hypothetical protein